MDTYISREVPVPERDEAKALHKKNFVKAKNIIVDSINDHLILQVSSLKRHKKYVLFLDQDIRSKEHKLEDDFEKPVEECKNPKCRDHTVILYKGLSNQRTT